MHSQVYNLDIYFTKNFNYCKTFFFTLFTDQSFNFNGVTVPFLNAFYKIQTNKGSSNQSQGVFETNNQKYSPNDVKQFQQTYGLSVQAAIDKKGGASTTDACFSRSNQVSTAPDCYEGNLDLQYIMGISQQTNTYYWYDGSGNAFLSWIISVSNTKNPPMSHSISWGTVEQVFSQSPVLIYFLLYINYFPQI